MNYFSKSRRVVFSIFFLVGLMVSTGTFAANGTVGDPGEKNLFATHREKSGRLDTNFLLAQTDESSSAEMKNGDEKELSPECAAFAKDPMADVGEIMRAGCEPTLAQMSKLMDNPLGNVAMFINQYDFYQYEEPISDRTDWKHGYTGIFQFPKGLGKKWNLINRAVFMIPTMPMDQDKIDAAAGAEVPPELADQDYGEGQGPILPPTGDTLPIDVFEGRTTGFGDLYYVGLFSPKEGIKHETGGTSVWGVGFDAGFPSASKNILGTGKWLLGPSALYAYMGPKWKLGGLWQQYWDYAGDDDRDHVTLSNIQYFYYYSLNDTMSIGAGPNIIINWEQESGDRLTLPVGLGINKTVNFGKLPVRFGLEAHYSVIQPDDVLGQKWDIRFMMIPAIPSAMFKWME